MNHCSDKGRQTLIKKSLLNLCQKEEFVCKIRIKLEQKILNNKNLSDEEREHQIKLINDDNFLKSVMQKAVEKCKVNDFVQDLMEEIIYGINDFIDSIQDEFKI